MVLRRTFNGRLNFLILTKNYSRNFHCVSQALPHVSSCGPYKNNGFQDFGRNRQIQQSRNLSMEDWSNYGTSLYKYVTSSDVSIQLKALLLDFHDSSGLPWWAVITLMGATVKLGIGLPVSIFQQHTMSRVESSRVELTKLFKEEVEPEVVLRARRGQWNQTKIARHMYLERKKLWKKLVVKNNCHPLKIYILSVAQFPVWVLISYTLRDLVDISGNTMPFLIKLGLQTEGVWWNTDMSLPDTTMILPMAVFLSTWIFLDISTFSSTVVGNLLSKVVKFVIRVFSIAGLFIGMITPSGLILYWFTSLFCGILIQLVMLSPRVRRFLRIPITSREIKNPYRNLISKFKNHYLRFFGISKMENS